MGSQARLMDTSKRIVEIVWTQETTPDDINRVTEQIRSMAEKIGSPIKYIVDMRTVKAFRPDSQLALVEHQKELTTIGMSHAAVIVEGTIAKLQLKRSAKSAGNPVESHWNSYEEALHFLTSEG
ncbi:hypothetical protein N6H14_15225 [Paenibacillus sp. CC-CFT747]|nr:hypothetical protein N6H14_15225 [Paenibacillus sp. CC-CFT747]